MSGGHTRTRVAKELLVTDHGLRTHVLLIAYAAVVVDEQRTGDDHHHEKEYPQANPRRAQPVGR